MIKPSVVIGASRLHIARITSFGTRTSNPVYDVPVECLGLVDIDVKFPEKPDIQFEGANMPNFNAGSIKINNAGLIPQAQQYCLGRTFENGVVEVKTTDKAPPVAILWEERKANGKRVRKSILHAILSNASVKAQTLAEGIEFQTLELSGEVYSTLNDRVYRECHEEDNSSQFNNWFTAVQL